jgi:hypothetical protein
MNTTNDRLSAQEEELDEVLGIIDSLRAADERTAQIDLVAGVRARIGVQQRDRARVPVRPAFLACAFVTAVALIVSFAPVIGVDDGIRAKSAGGRASPVSSWTGVQVYRQRSDKSVERIAQKISSADFLLFSYTHVRPGAEKGHLAIFAVASSGGVYWYYPSYTDPATNPPAIEVPHGAVDRELPEKVQHDFTAGPLAIYALFSAEPLRVRQIESAVAELVKDKWPRREPPKLALPGVYAQHIMVAEVEVE